MRDILLDAPLPHVALALTVVVVAAALMYRVDRGNRHLPGALRAALGLVRTATLAVLVLLLFQPVLRIEESTTRQPALLILQDRSLSIGSEDPEWGSTFQAWVDGLPTTAGTPGAAVELYGFGSEPLALDRLDDTLYSDPTTDLSAALDAVRGQWAGAPIGAIVIATDGRFNRGRSPEAEGQRIPAPLHVITLGDTSLKKDVRILRLLHNDVAGLGNTFPIEVELGAQGYRGKAVVRLSGPGEAQTQEVNFDGTGTPLTVRFLIEAKQPGIQRYRIWLDAIQGEDNTENNTRTALVDVIEGRKRILISGPAPHPDQGAWANALSSNINYEVVLLDHDAVGDPLAPGDWDAAFLFSFDPSQAQAAALFTRLKQAGIPIGVILDPLSPCTGLQGLGLGFDFRVTRQGLTADPKGSLNPAFPHFQTQDGMEAWLAEVPPLMSPFGEADWGPAHTPLLFQKIGGIQTEQPLLTLTQTASGRGMVLLGEGSWRWRQVGFLRTGTHELFDDLIGKLAQFLTSDPGIDRFRVDAPRILDEDQRLQMQARAYDATLQPYSGADIALELTDSAGTRFNYRFSAAPTGGYALDAGRWPRGTYTWRATTEIGGTAFERNGLLEVRAMALERNGRPADHAILQRMAQSTGGIAVDPARLDSLTAVLSASGRFTPERDWAERLQDIIQWKLLAYILLGLLSVEWMIRRWAGTY